MVFDLNMATLWALALVMLLAGLKVLLKVVFILTGSNGLVFDIRKLPEFLDADILREVGGLLILALATFLKPTALPEAFAATLVALHALFYTAAAALAMKYLAKIKDQFPVKQQDDSASADLPRA